MAKRFAPGRGAVESVVTKRTFLGLAAAGAAVGFPNIARAQTPLRLEISLETGPNHIRNIGMTEYADELMKKAGGKLDVKIFHGAAKFKDTDVPKALTQGALDMGLPGTWQLGKYVEDFDAPDLPIFYGAKRHAVYKVWDGPAGAHVVEKIEKKLGVKVIGPWLDLGSGQTFTVSKAIKTHADFTNLKVRIPGGSANIARYQVLGANPIKIAWPDVPQALQRGTIDGLFTTFESTRSAKLWDSGVRHCYVNDQTFLQYLPMISAKAWASYPKEIQELIVGTWGGMVNTLRDRADERQNSARADAIKNGITVVDPSKEDIAESRKKLLAKQDALVAELKIDPELIKKVQAILT
ncbi:MAG TPA: TRAP transporter substrate-binding protein DctP [Hyphomicrobiaceae bacterium]|nr:TRAP transporter substrate-binding protein DctP [Hyphomicrobiaceae bacterium]